MPNSYCDGCISCSVSLDSFKTGQVTVLLDHSYHCLNSGLLQVGMYLRSPEKPFCPKYRTTNAVGSGMYRRTLVSARGIILLTRVYVGYVHGHTYDSNYRMSPDWIKQCCMEWQYVGTTLHHFSSQSHKANR